MAINSNWPLTVTNVAFTTDPFDQNATPSYTDISLRAQDFSCSSGKQYELDATQAGEATYTLLDPDEQFNPSNPYSPYRTGNLLVNMSYDPSFDSYTAGTTPAWVTGVGVTPTISTTNPQAGANDLAFTTSVSGTPQGFTVALTGLTVGYNYTASAYVRKETGTDNVQISIAGGATGLTQSANAQYNRLVVMFTASTTSHTLQVLTTAGPTGANVVRVDSMQLETSWAPLPFTTTKAQSNVKVYRQIADQAMWPPVPVGGNANIFNTTWGNSVSQSIDPTFESYANGSTPAMIITVGGVTPTVTTTNPFQGTQSLTFNVVGNSTEQGVAVSFPTIPGQSYICSMYVRQTAANTMLAFIGGGSSGTSTTTTGSYVRLWTVWTASNTSHLFWVATFTPTLASTVNIDAIQIEPIQPMNNNPDFRAGTINWTGNNAALTRSNLWSTSGEYALQMVATGGTGAAWAEADRVAVSPNTLYKFQGSLYAPNGTGAAIAGIRCDWFTAGGAYITTSVSGAEQTLVPGVPWFPGFTDTSPGTAAFASIQVSLTNTPSAGTTMLADDVQLLPATPSTFSSTGPVIWGVFHGYVERWPSSWNYQGTYGLSLVTCVDAFAPMAGQNMTTEFVSALKTKNPLYYWPLNEANGTSFFADGFNSANPSLYPVFHIGTGGTYSPGTSMGIPGDAGGTGVQFAPALVGGNQNWYSLDSTSVPISLNFSGTSWSFSLAFWYKWTSGGGNQGNILVVENKTVAPLSNDSAGAEVFTDVSGNVNFIVFGGGAGLLATSTTTISDGNPHYVVATASLSGGTLTTQLWVDAALAGSGSGAAGTVFSTATPNITYNCVSVEVGDEHGGGAPPSATLSHVSIFNYALAFGDVNALRTAGQFGYSGESSGTRISRYLGYYYIAPSMVDGGSATMGISPLTAGTSLLDACQAITTSENGDLFVDPNGRITFQARSRRYLFTTPSWIFGENQAGGEIPYNGDIDFDYDPTQVFNDVTVDNSGGIKAVGGTATAIAASQKRYGKRSYSRNVNVGDLEAQDAANWLFAAHQDPVQRLNQVTINPAANPNMWLAALGIRIGDRVTVKRRTTMFTQQADFFIERIEHSRAPGQWLVTYQMSPATFAVNLQPGILDNTTYGLLDISAIEGY